MYAIQEDWQTVNDETIRTFSREVRNGESGMTVAAGTNGFTGGNTRKEGGRTYVMLKCDWGDFHFRPIWNRKHQMVGMEIGCCGDSGLKSMMESLKFAAKALKEQCNG